MTVETSNPLPPLDAGSSEPYYRQIYNRFRHAIATGLLLPGDRISSARALTKELGLARGTIDTAYALLTAEGYLQSRGQAGTFVTPDLKLPATSTITTPPPPTDTTTTSYRPDTVLPFQMGLPALDVFPRKIWARLGAQCLRGMQAADMTHPAVAGLPSLRTEIAAYLQVARGIDCTPSQVFITSGYRHTLSLIARALLKAGDTVWLENPGYPPSRELLHQLQIAPVPVPVDNDGMVVSDAIRLAPNARAALVTPAHQSPLCVTLSLARRLALLDWATQQDAWIIEDDYDGEYRYVSRPLPALKSLDRDNRVLYAGTFSKVVFPGLRLAYLVVPQTQIERFEYITQTFVGGSPDLTQSIVSAFITEGHFARHIQRMRKLYAQRRQAAAAGLASVLGQHVRIDTQPGGMHLILRLAHHQSDQHIAARMRQAGLYAEALTKWTMGGESDPALLLGFTNIDSEHTAVQLAQRMLPLLSINMA